LERLYVCKKGLKVEVDSLLNFPLGPSNFEKARKEMQDKYGIKEHPAKKYLYAKQKMWIMAYFKGLYCGIIISTQRSESTNRVLKGGFINSVTPLHKFVEKMLEVLQHMDHIYAEESHGSQV
jgi:hypothetical protein